MQVIDVTAAAGISWIKQSFLLFRQRPIHWIGLTSSWLLVSLGMLAIPGVGLPLFAISQPALCAGMMLAAREQDMGRPFGMGHLFAAFQVNGRALLTLGSIIFLAELTVTYVLDLMGFPSGIPLTADNQPDLQALSQNLQANLPLLAFGIAAMMLIKGIFWFAPPLLAFNPITVTHAIRWSLYAFISNISAMLTFALATLALFLLASLPWGLGMLIALPLFMMSNYVSYRHVFQPQDTHEIPIG
ncbi:MAG: hypothetical protein JNM52_01405 [Betaproteobacteria bacterium]|nr:hypothetical protein [Betaproteobacteria bacterium]